MAITHWQCTDAKVRQSSSCVRSTTEPPERMQGAPLACGGASALLRSRLGGVHRSTTSAGLAPPAAAAAPIRVGLGQHIQSAT